MKKSLLALSLMLSAASLPAEDISVAPYLTFHSYNYGVIKTQGATFGTQFVYSPETGYNTSVKVGFAGVGPHSLNAHVIWENRYMFKLDEEVRWFPYLSSSTKCFGIPRCPGSTAHQREVESTKLIGGLGTVRRMPLGFFMGVSFGFYTELDSRVNSVQDKNKYSWSTSIHRVNGFEMAFPISADISKLLKIEITPYMARSFSRHVKENSLQASLMFKI